ncbi:8-oxo-dGTP diphosphatase [Candidatus Uhrbacteria bacterium]|nr:8-oxo-dGTP diphosphatase [Candidatus Uhrbacteria bacterium]
MEQVAPVKKVVTLCVVRRGNQVLLGFKKRGFLAGKWNGFGGKVQPGETVLAAAARELKEEAGISCRSFVHRGIVCFHEEVPNTVFEMHVFEGTDIEGEPVESEEMRPQWFPVAVLPYEGMSPDDKHWMPVFFTGNKFRGDFYYDGTPEGLLRHELHAR